MLSRCLYPTEAASSQLDKVISATGHIDDGKDDD